MGERAEALPNRRAPQALPNQAEVLRPAMDFGVRRGHAVSKSGTNVARGGGNLWIRWPVARVSSLATSPAPEGVCKDTRTFDQLRRWAKSLHLWSLHRIIHALLAGLCANIDDSDDGQFWGHIFTLVSGSALLICTCASTSLRTDSSQTNRSMLVTCNTYTLLQPHHLSAAGLAWLRWKWVQICERCQPVKPAPLKADDTEG